MQPPSNVQRAPAVQILTGPFQGFAGRISAINQEKGTVRVLISMFGKKKTTVEIDVRQVRRIPDEELPFTS